jgi:DNA-binding transcriptional ArsR family regulator
MTTQDHLSMTFAALADPTRRAILSHLMHGEISVKDLARPFEMSLPGISKHLKVLERAGLIERGRTAQWRPCRLKAQPLKEASGWIEHYRRFWEASFDRLDKYLQQLQAESETSATAKPQVAARTRKKTRTRDKRRKHDRPTKYRK